MQAQQVLQQVVCFSLEEISLWGARKKLRTEDLKLTQGDALPPKDLASLGSKKIFNPKALAKFEALKKRAHVACGRIGIRFMGGYAVPESATDELAKELDKIGADFDIAKADFIATYAGELESWIAKHPGWEQWIRAATIPVDEVKDRIRYGWTPAKISTPDENNPDSRLNQKMTKEAGGLSGRLFKEIGEMAQKVLEDSLLGKTKVNRRVLSPIRKIRGKLNGLAFLDKRVGPLITAIDDTVSQMPGDAPIEGLALTALHGLILTLSDSERMKQYGQAILDGSPVAMTWGVATPKVEATQPKVEVTQVEVQVTVIEETHQPNLFDDTPVVPRAATQPEQKVNAIEVEAAAMSKPEAVEAAVKAEVPVTEAISAEQAEAETLPVEVKAPVVETPMVRVVEVVKELEPALPSMMPPPPKSMPFQRIRF